jgi:hypothetical protein
MKQVRSRGYLRGFFIFELGRTNTTKCAHPYTVYLMAPETHSSYCRAISKAPGWAVKKLF